MTQKIKDGFGKIANSAPHWAAMLLVVGMFIVYLERKDSHWRDEKADQNSMNTARIDSCHNIQSQGIAALERNTEAYHASALAFASLKESIDDLSERIGHLLLLSPGRASIRADN